MLAALLPSATWADVWQDPNTKVNYEYTPGEKEASVMAEKSNYIRAASPDAKGDINILSSITVDGNLYEVTSIGDCAFANCSNLTSVIIPNSVTSIGGLAFYGCTNLTSVIIPNSVTSIGRGAFEHCRSLTEITLPNLLTTIYEDTFGDCRSLISITIPKNVTTIYDNFRECYSLQSIKVEQGNPKYDSRDNCNAIIITSSNSLIQGCMTTIIPQSVRYISSYAFQDCVGLVSITIPQSVQYIASSAFFGCSGLVSIEVEPGNPKYDSRDYCNAIIETSGNKLIRGCQNTIIPNSITTIGEYAFMGCSNLTSIIIPNSVTTIGKGSFWGCTSLTNITIPNSVTSIEEYAFNECSGLTSITIPQSVTNIGSGAFYCYTEKEMYNEEIGGIVLTRESSLKSVILLHTEPPQITGYLQNAFSYTEYENAVLYVPIGTIERYKATKGWKEFESIEELGAVWQDPETKVNYGYTRGAGVAKVIVSPDVEGEIAILSKISIDGQNYEVTSIGNKAFTDCKKLTSLTIPNSVMSIDNRAFYGCENLSSLTIPNSVTSIDNYVLGGCKSLSSLTIPQSVTYIGELAFYGCNFESIEVETGNSVFDSRDNCHAIIETQSNTLIRGSNNTIIPNTVTWIGNYAFESCEKLTSITIPNTVTSIGRGAFANCEKLTSLTIPNTIKSIEFGTFWGCSSLTSMTIPNSVTSIGDYAFSGCGSLTRVVIPESVMALGNNTFQGCKNLKTVVSFITEPFVIDGSTFPYSSAATLYVPTGTKVIYEETEGWKDFEHIEEIQDHPVTLTALSYTREYGDENPAFEFTTEGAALNGEPIVECEATAASAVGTYDIVITKGSVTNYNDTYVNGTLTITKAPLTVKVGSYTKKQGEDNPEFVLTYEGFKNGETAEVLTVQPTVTTEAVASSEPGKYAITISGAEAQNYEITCVPGELTVTEADPVTLTALSYTREYGDENPAFEFTTEGAALNGEPVVECEATAASAVGTYDIVIKKGSVTNYNDTYVNGTLTITKAPLTVKVGSYSRKQGEENPEFVLEYEGFKNGETAEVLTVQPTVTTEAVAASEPGKYAITISGAEAQNYEITCVPGELTVTEADPVTLTALSYTREYGDENPAFEFTTEGAALNGEPIVECEATAASAVGTYDIVITKGSVTNYNDTYVNGTLTITKAPLTVKVGSYTKKQGEDNPEFVLTYEGFKNGETAEVLTVQPTVTTEAVASSEPGKYAITISGAEAQNYEITCVPGELTVTEADPVTLTALSYTREYGDENPAFEFTTEGAALNGEPVVECEATAASAVGTYDIVIKKGSVTNYNDTYVNGTLTITKAPLTVKVGSYSRKQGEENPQFELVYEGWKLQDTESVLLKKPVATTTATKDSPAGEYVITVSGGEARNYELTYVSGKLTVTVPSGIENLMKAGKAFDIYDVSGRKVRRQATTLDDLPGGVYVIGGKKVVVRK